MNILDSVRAVKRQLSPTEREFRRIWPAINNVEGLLISPDQERWLFGIARGLPDRSNIVEIGSFKGRSTCCVASGCKGTEKHVFAIDTFEGNEKDFKKNESYGGRTFFQDSYYEIFLDNLQKNGLTDYVTPLRGVSSDIGKGWDKPVHFLFIDGGHEYEDVLADFEVFFPHVVVGGMIAFHDVHNVETMHGPVGFPGVLKVWQEVAMPRLVDHGTCSTLAFGRKRAI